jgi:hypothetical protein
MGIATWEIGCKGQEKVRKVHKNPTGYGNKGGDEAWVT